jgi:hypothetical protein
MPGLVDGVLYTIAGLLSLVAILGVVGAAAGPVSAGFALIAGLLAPEAAVVVGLVALGALLAKTAVEGDIFPSTVPRTDMPRYGADEGGQGAQNPRQRPSKPETIPRWQEEAADGYGEDYIGVLLRNMPKIDFGEMGRAIADAIKGTLTINVIPAPGMNADLVWTGDPLGGMVVIPRGQVLGRP